MEKLSRYKTSLEEVDLREKQLAAMRIDICNLENLKKLKGAGLRPRLPIPLFVSAPPSVPFSVFPTGF